MVGSQLGVKITNKENRSITVLCCDCLDSLLTQIGGWFWADKSAVTPLCGEPNYRYCDLCSSEVPNEFVSSQIERSK